MVAVVPGNPEASELWRRITTQDIDDVMPPPAANKRPLTDDQKATIRKWIEQGAEYEAHWSMVPPARASVPVVKDAAWPRSDIDRFVLANLESHGVEPSPEADRATLLRRVYLDLTGLAPTPEEIASFVADESADAYEKRVQVLLTSEPYVSRMAERLASPWLDAARYADTCGIHTDNGRQMWLWRDWVLEAFRSNIPFDRFLTEQLAGDLIPDATVAQKIASGFNRNHVSTDEGGAIAEEYLVEYAVDRASTTSTVFLGLTMGCARCHDHKFDPISQADFYSMYAFFNSVDEPGLFSQTADANRAYEPFLEAPTAEQTAAIEKVNAHLAELQAQVNRTDPDEAQKRAAFEEAAAESMGVSWSIPEVVSAVASDPAVTLTQSDDRSFVASGPMPDFEDYTFTVRTSEPGQRLVLIEALPTPGAKTQGSGRTEHGNAVVSGITLESRSGAEGAEWKPIGIRWAWADRSQQDRDFDVINVIDASDDLEWAADNTAFPGNRLIALLADEPLTPSSEGAQSSEVRITLKFRSEYSQHSFGRVRLRLGALTEAGLSKLPAAFGRWYAAGPFPVRDPALGYETAFGPETGSTIDRTAKFGEKQTPWKFSAKLLDERPVALNDVVGAHYVGRTIYSPDARTVKVLLGSDDGFQIFLNGQSIVQRRIDRGLIPDQDEVALPLRAGMNTLVLKVVNTGGPGGYVFRLAPDSDALVGAMMAAAMPADALSEVQTEAFAKDWKRRYSEGYRATQDALAASTREREAVLAMVPRAMVMKELPQPRPTFVLTRGQYDKPDTTKPVKRGVPNAFGSLPEGAPENRLGLAQWMTGPDNPLVARVAVNRMWELVFGTGLVKTSDDFGYQGEWPSHPELLDTLAVEFREGGWDVRGFLKQLVLSSTYRQSSRTRQDVASRDPNNRWLSFYPRRRLSAEQLRDQALYVSGLLVEKVGGPSVKPYQPEGLWQEVAMPASNTREYVPGTGEDLHRRSLYTYWKRAVPPPALQTLDAPTREACTVRRLSTNTPLQALAMWNDTQFVEAARVLAQRTLATPGDDSSRLTALFVRCTGRTPDAEDAAALSSALTDLRARFVADAAAAAELVAVGATPIPDGMDKAELAAWTLVAGGVLNLHESMTQD